MRAPPQRTARRSPCRGRPAWSSSPAAPESRWSSSAAWRRRTRRAEPQRARAARGVSSATRLVQLRVDLPRRLRRNPRHALELLLGRLQQPVRRSEMVQQRTPPDRADALQLVEDRAEGLRLTPLPVEAEREPVSLVADPLQE